uniref:Apple domain-containing protein n=1 Tax=Globisporangium ultimum (strain ATCC 200006 / CBS 805.95 / DAOM BR144) TaxID=431595 RepID=K3WPX3_GLOUD
MTKFALSSVVTLVAATLFFLAGTVSAAIEAGDPLSFNITCETEPMGNCGNSTNITCCPNDHYCQPWNQSYYQCIPKQPQCWSQLPDWDFIGNDIKTVNVNHPNKCCDACGNTTGCVAYTYINAAQGEPVCYLKYNATRLERFIGAVTGALRTFEA